MTKYLNVSIAGMPENNEKLQTHKCEKGAHANA